MSREPGPNHGVMGVQNDHRGLSSFFRLFMGSEHSAARCDRNCRTFGALESYLGGLGGSKLAVLKSSGLLNSISFNMSSSLDPNFCDISVVVP